MQPETARLIDRMESMSQLADGSGLEWLRKEIKSHMLKLDAARSAVFDDETEETWDEAFDRRQVEAVEIFMEFYGTPPEDDEHSDLEVVEDILSYIPVQDIEDHNTSMGYATDSNFQEFETRQQYARGYAHVD